MKRSFRVRDYRPDADQDLSDELLAHQELMVEDLVAGGMSEEDARAKARRSLGRGAGAHATAAPQARGNLRRRSLLDRLELHPPCPAAHGPEPRIHFRRLPLLGPGNRSKHGHFQLG